MGSATVIATIPIALFMSVYLRLIRVGHIGEISLIGFVRSRDYLFTFLKIGTIVTLAIGVVRVAPELKMPAVTKFIDGTGPVWSGSLFPFLFITIACRTSPLVAHTQKFQAAIDQGLGLAPAK